MIVFFGNDHQIIFYLRLSKSYIYMILNSWLLFFYFFFFFFFSSFFFFFFVWGFVFFFFPPPPPGGGIFFTTPPYYSFFIQFYAKTLLNEFKNVDIEPTIICDFAELFVLEDKAFPVRQEDIVGSAPCEECPQLLACWI